MLISKITPLAIVIPFFLQAGFLTGQVLLNEQFPEDGRLTRSLPTTTAWLAPSNSDTLYDDSVAGELTLGHTGAKESRTFFMYFTDVQNVSLDVGEALLFRFDLRFNESLGEVRFGAFNHNVALGDRLTDQSFDRNGNTNTAGGVQGYRGKFLSSSTTSTNMTVGKRNNTNNALLSTNSHYTETGSAGPPTFTLGTTNQVSFLINRTGANEIVYSVTLSGPDFASPISAVGTDNSGIYTDFNMFGLLFLGNVDTLTLESFEVSIIPEPGQIAAGLGAVALLGTFLLRRRLGR